MTVSEQEQKEPANDDDATTIITIQQHFHYHTKKKIARSDQKKTEKSTTPLPQNPSSNNPTPTPHPPPTPLRTPRLRIKLPPKKPIRLIPQHAPNKPRPGPLHLPRLLKNLSRRNSNLSPTFFYKSINRCTVNVFFEAGPADRGGAHRAAFGVGVER